MKFMNRMKKSLSMLLAFALVVTMLPLNVFAADDTLTASLAEAKAYIDGITINNSSNDPATVVKNFKTHFTWDNEKRENSKSYLFDWSYYNGVVFEGLEYVYEVTGEDVYKDYVIEYMSSLINSNGGWATCSNNSSKQCAGYNSTHGADCYKTASLLMDAYEMTGDNRYLTMAATLYADLDNAAKTYLLKNAGNNFRHTWASDPSPDLWLDGLYMILPFQAEYAAYIGDTQELNNIVSRMQWVSDNMYNASKGLFYHAADNATSNSGTYWLRSIGWYAAAIVDIMDSMSGSNLQAMQAQLVKLVDGMLACQNTSNGMWLNNMNANQSASNPYETSGTALVCYAVMKAVNEGWLDESYADMAILAFNGICNEKLNGSTLKDICFKGAPGSSNSTFYDNEGKGVGPFIMFYAEMLEYVNSNSGSEEPEVPVEPETPVEPEEPTEPEPPVEPETPVEPEQPSEPETPVVPDVPQEPEDPVEPEVPASTVGAYVLDTDGIDVGSNHKYIIVGSNKNQALTWDGRNIGATAVTINGNTLQVNNPSVCEFYFVSNNSKERNTYLLTKDGSKTVYHSVGNMYYGNDNKGYWYVKNANNGQYQVYDSDYGTWYLNYGYVWGNNTANRFAVSSNTRTVRLYKYVETHTHGYSSVRIKPTCTHDGSITYTCVCGDSYVETLKATGHSYQDKVTEGTCTTQGYTTHTCATCGHSYKDNYTNGSGHDYKAVTVNATCTEKGSITYTCVCGDTYTETIEALGHAYSNTVVVPTCTTAGYTTYTCANCNDSYTANEIAALGHKYETVVVEATCESDGYSKHTCSVCGDSYVSDEIATKGHNYVAVVTAATCEEAGYTTHTCSSCGDKFVDSHVEALGHDNVTETVEPTCTEKGSVSTTCRRCDAYHFESVEALGHAYSSIVTEPTCETIGYTTQICSTCGHVNVDTYLAAYGHKNKTETVKATCITAGSVTNTCSTCGKVSVEVTPAKGHNHVSVTTAATCTTMGYTTHTCSVCRDSYKDNYINALGHKYDSVVTAATCTAMGYTTHTCSVCRDSYKDSYTNALGHKYNSVVTVATCTAYGYTTHTCSVCDNSYKANYTKALDHDYSVTESNGKLVHNCKNCGDNYTEMMEINQGYTKAETFVSNKQYVVTVASNNKYFAVSHAGNKISLVEVTVSNNMITSDITTDMLWTYSDNKLSYNNNHISANNSGYVCWEK